jgi:DNA topoisomerase 2
VTISDDSDEDTYIPLGERLKMKMQNDQRSSIVDELANTKSSVPASKRRRVTKKTTEETKKPAKKPARKAAKKKDDSDDSDDSLFGF